MYESTQIQKICSNQKLFETSNSHYLAGNKDPPYYEHLHANKEYRLERRYLRNITSENATSTEFSMDIMQCMKSLEVYDDVSMIKMLCDKYNLMIEEFSYNLYRLFYVKYFYPVLLTLGVLSNICSFFIMLKIYNQKKNSKFALTLAILSLADLAVLIFGCMTEYTEEVLDFSLRSSSLYACKLIFYGCYLFSCFSAYMHAFIAFERYRAIVNPIKSNILKSKRKKKTICIIFMFSLMLSGPFFYFAKINDVLGITHMDEQAFISFKEHCELYQNNFALDLTQALIDSVFYQFIPLLVIIVFSSLTAKELIANRSIFLIAKVKNKSSHTSGNHRQTRVMSSIQTQANKNSVSINAANYNTSLMLVILPLSCFLTKCPIFVIILLKLENNFFEKENSKNVYAKEFEMAKTLMFLNYSVNILYYIVFGKSYRKKFIDIITHNRKFTNFFKMKENRSESFL